MLYKGLKIRKFRPTPGKIALAFVLNAIVTTCLASGFLFFKEDIRYSLYKRNPNLLDQYYSVGEFVSSRFKQRAQDCDNWVAKGKIKWPQEKRS